MPRPPTDGLAFSQERKNDKGTRPINGGHIARQKKEERDISMEKFYNCNCYGNYYRNCPYWAPMEGKYYVNVRTAASSNKKNNDVPDSSDEVKITLNMNDLDDYDPTYDG